MTTPTADQISIMLLGVSCEAIIYVVPAVSSDGLSGAAGHAHVLRPTLGRVEALELPELDAGTLREYLSALTAALAEHDPAARRAEGFRGTPRGQMWAEALETLGAWTHTWILGPLIEHTRGWSLGREPHVALVSLGELAAIPYAAAWTGDPTLPGGRRYAVHDLVLTHTASARVLAEVGRRPRQRLTERVVLATDPTGEFPYTRRIAKVLAERQYPHAELYGWRARNGPATAAALLATLPRADDPGASLLQLSTPAVP